MLSIRDNSAAEPDTRFTVDWGEQTLVEGLISYHAWKEYEAERDANIEDLRYPPGFLKMPLVEF